MSIYKWFGGGKKITEEPAEKIISNSISINFNDIEDPDNVYISADINSLTEEAVIALSAIIFSFKGSIMLNYIIETLKEWAKKDQLRKDFLEQVDLLLATHEANSEEPKAFISASKVFKYK